MVTGPPAAIWLLKMGMTLPRLPRTLPKRTDTNVWPGPALRAASCTRNSTMRLLAPMTDVGLTALSVEMLTKCVTPCLRASVMRLRLPMTLLNTASSGFSSMSGTCLCAAAWKTTSGR